MAGVLLTPPSTIFIPFSSLSHYCPFFLLLFLRNPRDLFTIFSSSCFFFFLVFSFLVLPEFPFVDWEMTFFA